MAKRKFKVRVQEGAFNHIPEEEREGVMAEFTKALESDEFLEKSQPVRELPPGQHQCLDCGGSLEAHGVVKLEGEDVQFFSCLTCDKSFSGTPLN
jgi:hypothetical protein